MFGTVIALLQSRHFPTKEEALADHEKLIREAAAPDPCPPRLPMTHALFNSADSRKQIPFRQKTFFIIMLMFTQMGVTKLGCAEDFACSIENDLIDVEMKHLQYDKNDKPYYDRVFRPFPEEWSLAFPGLGKMRVKSSPRFSSAEDIKLEYFSLKGELLTTKELKIASLHKENLGYLATQGDLDVEFKKFFEKAKEGKVRVSILAKKKTICTFSVKILGILEQTD